MKKTLIALLALAGVAGAETTQLTALNDTYGTLIGGLDTGYMVEIKEGDEVVDRYLSPAANNAIETNTSFSSTYSTMFNLLTTSNEWYVSSWNQNVGQVTPTDSAVTVVAGGPKAASADGAIKFSLTADSIAQYEGPITFSFDVELVGGNNNKNHEFSFTLMTESWNSSNSYNSWINTTGTNADTNKNTPTTITLEMSAKQVTDMQDAGSDQTFIFVVSTNEVTGSNIGLMMSNFAISGQMVPEPTTATLSLLALAGLAARRRRK